MILSASIRHGGTYHFRVHKVKLEGLCPEKIVPLKGYLYEVLKERPDEYFLKGPRSSILKFSVGADLDKVNHEVCVLARMGLDSGYYDNAHMNVQMFMLAYDNKTIAIEVPLWLLPEEYEGFEERFNSDFPLSGHIDLIRIEDGKVWIWDFKPNARREKFAATQTYFYAVMLSKRTGLPLESFRCGYFDDKDCYVFNPAKIKC